MSGGFTYSTGRGHFAGCTSSSRITFASDAFFAALASNSLCARDPYPSLVMQLAPALSIYPLQFSP